MENLINEAILGDKDAFSLLFLQIQDDLYRIALSKTKNKEDAFDAIQETIIITYKNINQLKNKNSFKYWVMKILVNECYKIYNEKNNNIISIEDYNLLITPQNEYLSEFEKLESDVEFNNLINCLTYKERIVMLLYFQNEYTSKEISKITKIKENTIKSIIKRAKNKIKINLKGEDYEKLQG